MKKLYGVTVAMITPINANGEVDLKAVEDLTEKLINKGVNCLYPCGTTGEMLKLSVDERKKIAERILYVNEKRLTVYVHCGASNLKDTLTLIEHAKSIGCNGIGVVTPQFFKLTDRDMVEFYKNVSCAAEGMPVYMYSIPQCSANEISVYAANKIAEECKNIIGIKYSYPDINRTIDYLKINDFTFSVLHGCDRAMSAFLSLGCDGIVSGVAGVVTEIFVALYKAYKNCDMETVKHMQGLCVELCDALKNGSNIAYFKEALKMRGVNAGSVREPNLNICDKEKKDISDELNRILDKEGINIKL